MLSDNKSRCLIFMERIVYFDKKFAMSLLMYCPENASYKIIMFSIHERLDSDLFVRNSPLITLSLYLRGRLVTKGR